MNFHRFRINKNLTYLFINSISSVWYKILAYLNVPNGGESNKNKKMKLQLLTVGLSMVAGSQVEGSAAQAQAALSPAQAQAQYEKMPVERQRRFFVSQ